MPPDIIDIAIKAIGEYLDPYIEIVIKAAGSFIGGLSSSVDIVLKATPSLGGAFVGLCGFSFFFLMAWWFQDEHERG